jgi:hypothetical protein
MSRTTTIGLALLLVGVVTGAAGAKVIQDRERIDFLGSGLFTVDPGESVNFNATLDDRRGGPPARVTLRLLDRKGAVVARRDVTLEPGDSATLVHNLPGVFRAQAQIMEPDIPLGSRRLLLSTIEIFRSSDPQSLDLSFTGQRRFVCSSDDGAGNGRLPD